MNSNDKSPIAPSIPLEESLRNFNFRAHFDGLFTLFCHSTDVVYKDLTFQFHLTGYKNFDAFRAFIDKYHFPCFYRTYEVDEYFVTVDFEDVVRRLMISKGISFKKRRNL